MAQVSEKYLEQFKQICDKQGIQYKTEGEYREAAYNLINVMELLIKMDLEERRRKKRLEQDPKGFALFSEGRTCHLCGQCVIDEDMWYDKWAMKCLNCQDALNKKIIPGHLFKDHDNKKHITASTLSWKYNIHSSTIRKLARQGKLKARVIPGNGTMVFLRRENPNLMEIIESEKLAKRQ